MGVIDSAVQGLRLRAQLKSGFVSNAHDSFSGAQGARASTRDRPRDDENVSVMRAFNDLLRRAREGDDDAFASMWRALHPQLLRYLRVVVGDAAEDVASETWARVARDLDRFDGDERHFRSWVFTIGRHRALDWRRHEARRPSEPHPVEDFAERIAPDDTAGTVMESFSTDEALRLIATLPPGQAEVVTLRAVGGFGVEEVAAILGKRPGAIRVLAHRGLQRLARLVDQTDDDERKVSP
jgi:RNA polymerase sigma-70 factor, ECF subfamily